jgi:hypothetical protein
MTASRGIRRELTSLVDAECKRMLEGFTTRDVVEALPTINGRDVRRATSMLLALGWIVQIGEIRDPTRRFVFRWHGREGAARRRASSLAGGGDHAPPPSARNIENIWRARMGDRARFDAALTADEIAQLRRIINHGAQA